MRCQILFSRKNKKTIVSLLSAESAQSMLSVKVKVFNDCKQTIITAPDIFFLVISFDIFLFLHINICCGYSLEVFQ